MCYEIRGHIKILRSRRTYSWKRLIWKFPLLEDECKEMIPHKIFEKKKKVWEMRRMVRFCKNFYRYRWQFFCSSDEGRTREVSSNTRGGNVPRGYCEWLGLKVRYLSIKKICRTKLNWRRYRYPRNNNLEEGIVQKRLFVTQFYWIFPSSFHYGVDVLEKIVQDKFYLLSTLQYGNLQWRHTSIHP